MVPPTAAIVARFRSLTGFTKSLYLKGFSRLPGMAPWLGMGFD
jgi:hypothetical protein